MISVFGWLASSITLIYKRYYDDKEILEHNCSSLKNYIKYEKKCIKDWGNEDDIEWSPNDNELVYFVKFTRENKIYQLCEYYYGDGRCGFIIHLPTNTNADYCKKNIIGEMEDINDIWDLIFLKDFYIKVMKCNEKEFLSDINNIIFWLKKENKKLKNYS